MATKILDCDRCKNGTKNGNWCTLLDRKTSKYDCTKCDYFYTKKAKKIKTDKRNTND